MRHLRTALRTAVLLVVAASGCSDSNTTPNADALASDGSTDGLARRDGAAGDGSAGDGSAAQHCEPSAALLDRIDPLQLRAHLDALVGLGERRSLDGQSKAAAYLRNQLAGLAGLTVEDHTYSYKGASYANIVATVRGVERPDELILIGSHYDSSSNDAKLAPGADDNASGTAAVLEIARALAGCRPRRSARMLFFSNEEQGIIGSSAYVTQLEKTASPSQVVGYLNVDMIGYGPADEDLDLATRPAYAAFAQTTAEKVETWTRLKVVQRINDHCG